MSECYLCAAVVPAGAGFRRNLSTGTSNRVHYGRRVSLTQGETHGLRTVCAGCAYALDSAFPHAAHLVATILTGGLWGIGWALCYHNRTLPDPAAYGLPALADNGPARRAVWPWVVGGILGMLLLVGLFTKDREERRDERQREQSERRR